MALDKGHNSKKEESATFINLGIVQNKKGEVLMIRRVKKEAGRDGAVLTWAFPAGKQRYDESRAECVKREILAETGYEVNPIREISMRVHPQFRVFIVYHLCDLISPKPAAEPAEPHEVAEIRWVKPEKIRDLITTNLDDGVARALGLVV